MTLKNWCLVCWLMVLSWSLVFLGGLRARHAQLQYCLPQLIFFEGGRHPLLVIYLPLNRQFVNVFVTFYQNVQFKLVLR